MDSVVIKDKSSQPVWRTPQVFFKTSAPLKGAKGARLREVCFLGWFFQSLTDRPPRLWSLSRRMRKNNAKCQTPLHGHRLRTCCTTLPTDELTTIPQLVQKIHHQRTKICHIPTSWHVEMLGSALALWCGKFVVQQVVELLWACPLVVLYNMSVAGVRLVELGTKHFRRTIYRDIERRWIHRRRHWQATSWRFHSWPRYNELRIYWYRARRDGRSFQFLWGKILINFPHKNLSYHRKLSLTLKHNFPLPRHGIPQ